MNGAMRIWFRAMLFAVPAPFILAFLLQQFSPELVNFRAADGLIILGSQSGILAYLISFLTFLLVAGLSAQPAKTKSAAVKPRATRAVRREATIATDDDDQEGPFEGDEQGTVKWFNVKKGFGFITRSNGDEIFVHFRAIRGRGRRILREGQAVSYSVISADKGLQADKVTILED